MRYLEAGISKATLDVFVCMTNGGGEGSLLVKVNAIKDRRFLFFVNTIDRCDVQASPN